MRMCTMWRSTWFLGFLLIASLPNRSQSTRKPLYIASLLPTGQNDEWVTKNAGKSCRMAVDHVNAAPDILAGYELRLRTNASNCNIGLANYQLYEQLADDDKIVALIAEGCSVVTQPIAETTKYFEILQFNFLSSSPALENRVQYPLYHQLLPSETSLNPPRVAFMRKLEWTHCVILYEDADVFQMVSQDLRRTLRDKGIEVHTFLVSAGDVFSNINDVLPEVESTQYRIIFGLFYEETGRKIVCQAFHLGMTPDKYVWNFVGWFQEKEWYLNTTNCTAANMRETVNGHFTFDFTQISNHSDRIIPTHKTIKQVEDEFLNLTDQVGFQNYDAYGYDTVIAIALMLNETFKTHPGLFENYSYGDASVSKILNDTLTDSVHFHGLIGEVVFGNLTENHEEVEAPGTVIILYNSYDNPGSSDPKLNSIEIGSYDNAKKGFNFFRDEIKWMTQDGQKPVSYPPEQVQYSSEAIFIAIATIDVLGIILAIFLLAFTFYHRDKRIIKLSSPRMNYLIGIGAIFIYIAVILNGFDGQFFEFDQNSLRCCSARNTFLVFGFSLAFGSMFAKTWRVSMIMKRSKAGQRNLKLTDHVLFGIVGILLLVDVLLLSLWFGLDPYKRKQDYFKTDARAQFYRNRCTSSNSDRWGFILLAYKAIILAFGAFLAFDTRKVKIVSLNDSRFIALSVYNTVVTCILAFAFNFLTDPGLSFALTGIVVILMATIIIGLVFVPKVYLLLFRKDDSMGGIGRLGSKSKGSINEHTITKKSDLKHLQEENRNYRYTIRMLVEERNLSEETIKKVKNDLGLELEVFVDGDETLAATSSNFASKDELVDDEVRAKVNGSDSGMGKEELTGNDIE